MKRNFLLISLFTLLLQAGFCQDTENNQSTFSPTKGFKTENIFVGGGLNLAFASGTFGVGINPEIGYTIAPWLDAGIATNFNYNTISADYNYGYSQRSFNYGAGVYARIYPIENLFLQVQPEHNWSNNTLKDPYTDIKQKINFQSNSLLAGIGYANRFIGRSSFYTVVMIDLLSDQNSPYRDGYNRIMPVIRGGFNIYLHPRKNR